MKQKKVMLVDIDNTLANINKELRKQGINTNVYPSPVPKDIWKDGTIYKDAKPILPIVNWVKRLSASKNNVLLYITSRPPETKGITEKWLSKHIGISEPVFYTEGMPKGEAIKYYFGENAMREIEWVAIDDAPHEIMSYLNLGIKEIFAPDWPYNRHIDDVYRLITDGRDLAAAR